MKKYYFLVTLLSLLSFTGCGQNAPGIPLDNNTSLPGDIGNDICPEFSADFIYSATGKPVVRIEPDWIMPKLACRYYFTYDTNFNEQFSDPRFRAGGELIFIMLENLDVESQKKGIELLGGSITTDPRIDMEHFISLRENGSLRDIKLIINPSRYVRMEYGNNALTDEELIDFAAEVAAKIQGTSKLRINGNPVELSAEQGGPEELGAQQDQVVRDFLGLLATGKFSEALTQMDANEQTKIMWEKNFASLDSLQIKNMTPVYEDEWTAARQVYQIDLDARVNTEAYGWQDGTNRRWITIEKSGDTWLIHEIANNP